MPQTTIHLRVPPALHERLRDIGAEQSTSLNQTIVLLLTSATAGFEFRSARIPQRSPGAAVKARGTTTPEIPDDAASD
jgi:HicB family